MIPYGKQSICPGDLDSVLQALQSEYLTTGPLVSEFESVLERLVGAPTVVVSSGTAALHCAYAAIDIQPGDEVITPAITFIATQATAALMGAKILFADVQPDTANIDPKSVEKLITSKTKAIVAVDYAGHPADLSELRELADNFGIRLIEDASHSLGSYYRNRPVGSIADITTFSFFPTKNITTAEGGAISSTSSQLLERARKFSRQGLIREPAQLMNPHEGEWHQEVHEFGINYRLPDILCALGISQLKNIHEFKEKREKIFTNYSEAFSSFEDLTVPTKRNYVNPMWHLYPLRVPIGERKRIFSRLRHQGIGVQVNYLPVYLHPVFKKLGYQGGSCPVAESFYNQEISLPMHVELNKLQQEHVIESVIDSLND